MGVDRTVVLAAVLAAACADAPTSEDARLADLSDAWGRRDCAAVEALAPGFAASTELRLHAVTSWFGGCLYRDARYAEAEAVLGAAADAVPGDVHAGAAAYTLGKALYRVGRFDDARTRFEAFRARYRHHARFVDATYTLAKTQLRSGDGASALTLFAEILALLGASESRRAGATYGTGQAHAALAGAAPESPEWDQATTWLKAVATGFGSSSYADDAAYALAKMPYRRGRFAEAESTLAAFGAAWPGSRLAPFAAYTRARAVEAQGRATEALALYLDVEAAWPDASVRDDARYRQGRVRYALASAADAIDDPDDVLRYAEAAEVFTSLLTDFPASTLATAARYFRARCRYERKEYGAALADLASVTGLPDSTWYDNALYTTGGAYYHLDSLETAIVWFDRLLAERPASSYADDAAYFRARSLYRLGRLAEAEAAFAALPAAYPTSPYADNAWLYLVLSRAALGDCAGASAAYPHVATADRAAVDAALAAAGCP